MDTIAITGLVATAPRHIITSQGLAITSFRVASPQRKFDETKNELVEADTNWYTVTSFRQLALNLAESVQKGERILVIGKLRIRDWDSGERNGTTVEIEAQSIGHDLNWGTSNYKRVIANGNPESNNDRETQED